MSKLRDQCKPISDVLLAKLPNRRIKAALMKDGTINFSFKRVRDDGTIHTDGIRLSPAAIITMQKLAYYLYKRVTDGNYDKSRLSKKEWQTLCFDKRPAAKFSIIGKHG